MTKAEELLRKEITFFEWGKDNDKQLIPYEDALKAVNKTLIIGSVSNRRVLLLDFLTKHDKSLTERDINEYVDEYLQI